jgi:acetolactate synthase-1/2/3 large subunit
MNEKKISDVIADFLKEQQIDTAFGIIGSANSYIFDSINALGYTKIIYMHHEQSVVMAMGAYFRASNKLSVALVTAGGGSSNAITGVVSNWADSIPGLIISGQEQNKYMQSHKHLRMYGIQGYDSPEMVNKITKYAKTIGLSDDIQDELENSTRISINGRPGPVWLDIPFDTQSKKIIPRQWNPVIKTNNKIDNFDAVLNENINFILEKLTNSKRPVIIAGHGIRISDSKSEFKKLVDKLKIPILLSWSAIDVLPEDNKYNFGRSGVMGERCSNFIVQNSDLVITLGSRLSLLQTGYDLKDFASNAKLIINDIDTSEAEKHKDKCIKIINLDTKDLILGLLNSNSVLHEKPEWLVYCKKLRTKYPKLLPEHDHPTYINSYKFIDKLSNNLNDNDIIVTDMGTGLLSGHYSIKLKENQTMFTSLGLGEMGYGLPGAIGASFTDLNKNVLCLNCDGGIMMNLQELQTIKHHNLPIKIVIFNNDGYLMIKHTQKMLFNGIYNGVNSDTGLSLPDFEKIATAFNFPYVAIRNWEQYNDNIDKFLHTAGPTICEVFMDPEQDFIPKVKGIKKVDGGIFAPPIEEMSPLLTYQEIEENMISGVNPKSKLIQR